jgi:hypothetical protein
MFTKMALLLLLLQVQQTPVTTGAHHSGNLSAKLRTTVHDYHLSARNFVEALTHVATEFRIPMGIEWVIAPSTKARINLSFKDATVEQVLQAIVKDQPGVKVVVERDIVHVFAPGLIPDRENPLKLNINEFEVHDVPAELASRRLHEVVTRTLLPPKPQQGFEGRGGTGGSGFSNSDDPKISVSLRNATLEDVLDALALASARKIWVVTFLGSHALTPSGYRRTGGLWTNRSAPDAEQPFWSLLHWGDKIPVEPSTAGGEALAADFDFGVPHPSF